jgi:hypothetical protein
MAEVGHPAGGRRPGVDRAVVAEDPGDGGVDPRGHRGFKFDQNVDLGELLAGRKPRHGFRPRPPRLEVECKASVKLGKTYYTVDVHDISLGGMKVEPIEEYCLGKKVVVVVESLRPIKRRGALVLRPQGRHRVRQAAEVRGARRMGRQAARAGQPQGELTSARPLSRPALPIFAPAKERSGSMAEEVAVLAGGCFWCTEAVFLDVVGVKRSRAAIPAARSPIRPTSRCAAATPAMPRRSASPSTMTTAQLRRSARHLLRDPRPDPAQPPGQ